MIDVSPPAVLGIDAAWTANEPSGVALVVKQGLRWRCLRVAPSYTAFCNDNFSWLAPVRGALPDVKKLLDVCSALIGHDVLVVAVDMPLATQPITGRRVADDLISRQFGARKCAVHSPSIVRPSAVGADLYENFVSSGFPLELNTICPTPALIEVYPHVALLDLMNANERLPYKVSKSQKYWGKACTLPDRKRRLVIQWVGILDRLRQEIDNIDIPLPAEPDQLSFQHLKRYEDAIDALVCAWMATQYLTGNAAPIGDNTAAIWIPASLN
jgi:predicted RNase H-like nuclease